MRERIDWQQQPAAYVNWWSATNVAGEPRPSAAGSQQRMVLESLKPGQCFFAIRSHDRARNRSSLSNMADVTVR
jgi:hypothetical protein